MKYIRTLAKSKERIESLRRHLERRNLVRIRAGKRELVTPLVMASPEKLKDGISRGFVPFVHNGQEIKLPLDYYFGVFDKGILQGVYSLPNGELYTLRTGLLALSPVPWLGKVAGYVPVMKLNLIIKLNPYHEVKMGFCWIDPAGGLHLEVSDPELRYRGLALKMLDKVIRSYTTKRKNPMSEIKITLPGFEPVLRKYGAKIVSLPNGNKVALIKKDVNPKANIEKYHSIEAIDPNSGRQREYRFKVEI